MARAACRRRVLSPSSTTWDRQAHEHWFTSLAGSARTRAFHVFARKLDLCRGPDLNRRHMVLQTIALPAELPRRSTHFTARAVRPDRHMVYLDHCSERL